MEVPGTSVEIADGWPAGPVADTVPAVDRHGAAAAFVRPLRLRLRRTGCVPGAASIRPARLEVSNKKKESSVKAERITEESSHEELQ